MDPATLTIHQARELLLKKEITPEELLEAVYSGIEEKEDLIGAYITLTKELAFKQAEKAKQVIEKGDPPVLCGIPVSIKDLICTSGIRTTCASRILENFIPPYNATVAEKIFENNAVMVGKTNMDEFAMGSTTETSAFHVTRNPSDPERIPGGSSGGSAASVAAHMCLGSLGSDTGGSIRQPASHCGVVGLKPTYGRVSRFGLVAYASSFDQIGPITKDVRDAAIMFSVIAGHDPKDSTSATEPVPDLGRLAPADPGSITIGIPREYIETEGIDPDVRKAFSLATNLFAESGAKVKEISLAHTPYAVATYYIIAPAEASSNLARYDGVKYGFRAGDARDLMEMYAKTRSTGFGPEVKRRILLGTYALSAGYYDAYYRKASQVRTLIYRDFESAFAECDLVLAPVSPSPACRLGEMTGDPLKMYLSDIFTLPANLAGIPAISVPCALSSEGLPIGVQLMAAPFAEKQLLAGALFLEKELGKPAMV